jgi:hypothetical protein
MPPRHREIVQSGILSEIKEKIAEAKTEASRDYFISDDVHETAEHRADNLVDELIPAVEKCLEEFKGPQTPYNLMLAELKQEVQSRSSK